MFYTILGGDGMKHSEKFFSNKDCPYFPCHKGLEDEHFNCLFCYCPLYFKTGDCGGNYRMIDLPDGSQLKDCTDCLIPHNKDKGYDYIMKKLMP